MLSILRSILTRLQLMYFQAPTPNWKWFPTTSDNQSLVDVVTNAAKECSPIALHNWTTWHSKQGHTDNDSDISTRRFSNGLPHSTQEPDWDVLHKIKWALSHQLSGGRIIHTKGHHDDSEEYKRLLLLAQPA